MKPWEAYQGAQQQAQEDGPWSQYQTPGAAGAAEPSTLPPLAPQQQAEARASGVMPPEASTIYENPDPAGPVDAFRFSMIEDPRVRISKFAAERFPNEPPEVRERRYGIVDGEVVFRGTDGRVYSETSGNVAGVSSMAGRHLLPITGLVLGALSGGTMAPLGAALGAGGGLGYRKVAGLAQGDVQDPSENIEDMKMESLLALAGGTGGSATARRVGNRRAVRDVARYQASDADQLIAAARNHGITLTPAEASNLGSLINQQTRLGTGMDEAGDILRQFYGERAGAISRAVDDYLGKTPPAARAGLTAREVAGQSIDDATAAVSSGTRNAYQTVARPGNLVDERRFMEIDADPLISKYINMVKESPEYGLMDAPRNSAAVIDMAGKLMREEADKLVNATGGKAGVTEGALRSGRQRLLGFLEESYPSYNWARNTQRAMRETHLDPLTQGVEGVIARTKDTSLAGIPEKLLKAKGVSPESVADWRRQFISQNRGEDWDKLVNAYLRNVWEDAAQRGRTIQDLSGPRFRELVFGTTGKQKILREALGPERFKTFKNLMEVLEAVGRVPRGGSQTQPAQEFARQQRRAAAPIATFARETEITAPWRPLADWWIDAKASDWQTKLANIITSPDAMRELENLRVLRQVSPTEEGVWAAVTGALTRAGVLGAENALAPENDMPPPPAQAAPRTQQAR